jgi:glutathione peroxidase
MTTRQRLLKLVYPLWMWWTRKRGRGVTHLNNKDKKAAESFYDLRVTLNNDAILDFSFLKGKKVILVNTASDCGYTDQYEGLQRLFEENKDRVMIIGFPANDFKQQEKGDDEEIAQFCKINYGVSFPLAKKSTVIKSPAQNNVFRWLSDEKKNGWNDKAPSWNFCKFIVDENGMLTDYFGPSVSPNDPEILEALNTRKSEH